MSTEARPCAVYRHFDEWSTLLYVGMSETPDARDRSHIDGSEWARFVAHGSVEWWPSIERAAIAEVRAIQAERPVFNRMHAVGDPDQRITDYYARRDLVRTTPRRRRALVVRPVADNGLVTLVEAALALGLRDTAGLKRLQNARDRRSPGFPQPREGGGQGRVSRYDLDELRTWLAGPQQSPSVIEGDAK